MFISYFIFCGNSHLMEELNEAIRKFWAVALSELDLICS